MCLCVFFGVLWHVYQQVLVMRFAAAVLVVVGVLKQVENGAKGTEITQSTDRKLLAWKAETKTLKKEAKRFQPTAGCVFVSHRRSRPGPTVTGWDCHTGTDEFSSSWAQKSSSSVSYQQLKDTKKGGKKVNLRGFNSELMLVGRLGFPKEKLNKKYHSELIN